MQNELRDAILRTLAFQSVWSYAPTRLQLFLLLDIHSAIEGDPFNLYNSEIDDLINEGTITEENNSLSLTTHRHLIAQGKANEIYFPRKLKKVRRVVWFLKKIPWIRAICLCNTAALGQSRQESDLDFFIICSSGAIWRTRFFSTLPFKILNARPGESNVDPICLSFFISDSALNLGNLSLEDDDPYMRYWFLSLLPLYDDGVLENLWQQNQSLISRHNNAIKWSALDKGPIQGALIRKTQLSNSPSSIEKWLRQIQSVRFPKELADKANQDTRVVINDNVLKFHVGDRRKQFRDAYYQLCHDLNIQP